MGFRSMYCKLVSVVFVVQSEKKGIQGLRRFTTRSAICVLLKVTHYVLEKYEVCSTKLARTSHISYKYEHHFVRLCRDKALLLVARTKYEVRSTKIFHISVHIPSTGLSLSFGIFN
jgi:hypothetical protein